MKNFLPLNKAGLKNKILLLFFLPLLLMKAPSFSQNLVWSDEFNGTTLDGNNWTYDFGDGCSRGVCGWGNSELEYYTSRTDNVYVQNGNLVIAAKKESFGGKDFTSGRIKTEGRVHFKYGTLEARIKIPNLQNGLWPAFWMLGITGTWPANGEIDIAELGSAAAISAGVINRRVGGACHWDYNGSYAEYGNSTDFPSNLNDDYHIYKMVWDAQYITCYIDNVQYFQIDISAGAAASLEEFHIQHYILLNLAVGGAYTGVMTSAGITAPMPGQMYVDYIRLYQNPGSELYLGKDHAETGTYGVFTETTPVTNKLTYGVDANLYVWNGLTAVAATPYEGTQVWSYNATAGNWIGFGVATDYKNMSNFYGGYLNFQMKTTATQTFTIGVSTAFGDSWVSLVNGGQQYGMVRDGQWHQVRIPFTAFTDLDLGSVKQMFMLAGDVPTTNFNISIDNVYYSGGGGNQSPTVSITSPANGATYTAPASITINANASDPDGSISSVSFYNGSTLLGTDNSSPYSYTWTNVAAGTYTITARATDNGGASTTSSGVSVTVNNAITKTIPGTIQAEAYDNMFGIQTEATTDAGGGQDVGWIDAGDWMDYNVNVTAAGTYTINFRVAANDAASHTVQLRSGSATLASATFTGTGGWQVWTTTSATATLPAGSQTLRVYCSTGGFNVNWIGFVQSGNTPPTVSITSPANGATYTAPASITINATAADANGSVSSVAFYNGSTLLGTDNSSPYSYNWTNVAAGSYSITARATDNQGATTTSSAVSVTVNTGTNTPPTVSITSPANGATYTAPASITINATAADANGSVSSVAFYNGSTLLGTDNTSPYSYSWTNVAAGSYSITAMATDNQGATTTSAAVSVTVNGGTGTNLALNKPASVSSAENAGTPGSNAVDGNTGTRWSSAFSDPQWIYVDLGATYTVNRVKVTWETACASAYQIQISTDASTWTTMRSITGNATLVNDNTGLSGTGRYVRIYGTARATQWGYSIFELEVYGTPGTTPFLGHIEAENYTAMNGIQTEATTDAGGGLDVGWIDATDWMDYSVNIPATGTYQVDYRVASVNGGGSLQFRSGSTTLATTTVNATGGWQTWTTLTTSVNLNAGAQTVRLYAAAGGFNVNWFDIYTAGAKKMANAQQAGDPDGKISLYPVPTLDELNINSPVAIKAVTIFDVSGRICLDQKIESAYNANINVSALLKGVYMVRIETETGIFTKRMTK